MARADVVVQLLGPNSQSAAFSEVAAYCPGNIVILPARAADQANAKALYDAVIAELQVLGTAEALPYLDSLAPPEWQNLLVLVASDSQGPIERKDDLDAWLGGIASDSGPRKASKSVLPVLEYKDPDRSQMAALSAIDGRLGAYNVAWWQSSITELTAQVLLNVGVVTGEFRLFISYKRDDCLALAEQLFSDLVKAGFSVFLDRFSVPRGALFQRYLTEQLEDKSMVLVIETTGFEASKWCQFEVAFAKRRRMGTCAITFPQVDVARIQSIFEDDRRLKLADADFDPATATPSKDSKLSAAGLRKVIQFVTRQHNLAFVRRRQMILKELNLALRMSNLAECIRQPGGAYTINANNREYKFCISPRPAELWNFYDGVHRSPVPPATTFVLITPHLKVGAARQRQLGWVNELAKLDNVQARHFDPIRIPILALMIERGKI